MHHRKSVSKRESEKWGQTDRHRAGESGESGKRKEETNAHKSRQKDRPTERNIWRKWEKEMCHGRAKREGNSLLERERRNIPLAESFNLAQFSDEDISL